MLAAGSLWREPGRAVGGGKGDAKADAFECKLAIREDQGLFWPRAIGGAAKKFRADRRGLDDKDLADAGDRRIGPDIGPGLGLVAGRKDFDQEHRIGEGRFFCIVTRAGNREVRDTDIGVRLNMRDDAGRRDNRARAPAFREMMGSLHDSFKIVR